MLVYRFFFVLILSDSFVLSNFKLGFRFIVDMLKFVINEIDI